MTCCSVFSMIPSMPFPAFVFSLLLALLLLPPAAHASPPTPAAAAIKLSCLTIDFPQAAHVDGGKLKNCDHVCATRQAICVTVWSQTGTNPQNTCSTGSPATAVLSCRCCTVSP